MALSAETKATRIQTLLDRKASNTARAAALVEKANKLRDENVTIDYDLQVLRASRAAGEPVPRQADTPDTSPAPIVQIPGQTTVEEHVDA